MSNINFRLLENLFERREEQTGYYIGERIKEDLKGKKYREITLFSYPSETLYFILNNDFKDITLIDAHKLNKTYTECNINLNNKWTPFQQHYVCLETMNYVYPLFKFGKDTLKELLNFEGEYGYQYAELVNNTDENSAANE